MKKEILQTLRMLGVVKKASKLLCVAVFILSFKKHEKW